MAPTGFNQRWKGKITAASLWLGGTQEYGSGAVYAGTSDASTIPFQYGSAVVASATAAAVYQMQQMPSPGAEFEFIITSVSSGIFLKAASGASFDASTNTVIKSTYAQTITLYGRSTVKWSVKSVFPAASTLIGGSGITLSTTT
jgi:hypothetical protein